MARARDANIPRVVTRVLGVQHYSATHMAGANEGGMFCDEGRQAIETVVAAEIELSAGVALLLIVIHGGKLEVDRSSVAAYVHKAERSQGGETVHGECRLGQAVGIPVYMWSSMTTFVYRTTPRKFQDNRVSWCFETIQLAVECFAT
jgi:hypothetical protein